MTAAYTGLAVIAAGATPGHRGRRARHADARPRRLRRRRHRADARDRAGASLRPARRHGAALRTVVEKLLRRHPHVFQENGVVHDAESRERAPSAAAALDRWNALKAEERAESGQRHSTLGSVPKTLPSLLRAYKIGKRVAGVGFEWATTKDVVAKVEEEVAELRDTLEREPGNAVRAEEEMEISSLRWRIFHGGWGSSRRRR